jgi:hypothetical protein
VAAIERFFYAKIMQNCAFVHFVGLAAVIKITRDFALLGNAALCQVKQNPPAWVVLLTTVGRFCNKR